MIQMKKYKFKYPVPTNYDYDLEKDYYDKGVIRKKDLIDGCEYKGVSRNSNVAVWDKREDRFIYERYKFGLTFDDYIEHIEDDDGHYDVFVPVKKNCGD